jgi:hypothetical protein
MNIAGVYERENRRQFSIEYLVRRIIPHQPQLKLHVFSLPGRSLAKVLPELSQPDSYLRSHTYNQTILTIVTLEHT